MHKPVHARPDSWIDHVFSAKAVERGGVVRRSVTWVEHEIGRERFLQEVRRRNFHLLESGGQFIVICSRAPIRKLV